MLLAAVTQSGQKASFPTLLAVLLIGAVVFGMGYRVAVHRRAFSDYKRTKAALPGMRKAAWLALWGSTKFGFWVLVVFAVLISWVVHDVRAG